MAFFPGTSNQQYLLRRTDLPWLMRRGGPKGQPFLLRVARRFTLDHPDRIPRTEKFRYEGDGLLYKLDDAVPCTCKYDLVTHEADKDAECAYCWGQGVLWDELWFTGYLSFSANLGGNDQTDIQYDASPGTVNLNEPFLFTFSPIVIRHEDWIVRSALDMDGNLLQPIQPQNIYKILHYRPMRMDFARVEFWKYKVRRVYP